MHNSLESNDYKPQSVKLSGLLVKEAEIRAKHFNRSKAGQIEFWAKIGKISEENPDLSFAIIQQILVSQEEIDKGQTIPFAFTSGEKLVYAKAHKRTANKVVRKNSKKAIKKTKN